MTGQFFFLVPFPAQNLPELTITGTISRLGNRIDLRYSLVGKMDDIVLAAPSGQPRRRAELWRTTCFEMFLAVRHQPRYWEFNFAPSGDWNIYRMDGYRRLGFGEERSVRQLPFQVDWQDRIFALTATIDLNTLVQQNDPLDIGLNSIILTKGGVETYWALTHPAPQPDFHRRESFILLLEGQTQPSTQPAQAD
jgi:hypothetical protein